MHSGCDHMCSGCNRVHPGSVTVCAQATTARALHGLKVHQKEPAAAEIRHMHASSPPLSTGFTAFSQHGSLPPSPLEPFTAFLCLGCGKEQGDGETNFSHIHANFRFEEKGKVPTNFESINMPQNLRLYSSL